jgi:hypothetical protein
VRGEGLLDTINVRGEEIHATLSLNLDIVTRLILQRNDQRNAAAAKQYHILAEDQCGCKGIAI